MMIDEQLLQAVMCRFILPREGLHGPSHWARVLENGLRLAHSVKVDRKVLELFALLHDSQRICDGIDRDHGKRAAGMAWNLRASLGLDDNNFKLLYVALAGHDEAQPDPGDDTVRVCWDAERLDLARLGITPRPACLFTEAARDPETIGWACERSRLDIVPAEVITAWKLENQADQAAAR